MRNRAMPALAAAICLAAFPAISAYTKEQSADDARRFLKQIPSDRRILQALNRLTFGPRPGDARQVKTMGLKKWLDLQLHPERIPENPTLSSRLKTLDTLDMSAG